MNVVIDLLMVLVIALFVVICYRRGFIRTFLGMFGSFLSAVIAFAVSGPVSKFFYHTFLEKNICDRMQTALTAKSPNMNDAGSAVSNAIAALPSFLHGPAESVRGEMIDAVSGKLNEGITGVVHSIEEGFIRPLALRFIGIFVMIIVFVLCLFVFKLIAKPLTKAFDLPIIGTVNKILGAGIGVIQGVVAAAIIAVIISLYVHFTGTGFWIFTPYHIGKSLFFGLARAFTPF